MTSPQYTVLFSCPVSGTAATGSVADVLLPDATTGLYVKATTANRGTRRSTGLALTSYAANGAVDIQQFGQVDATTAGLGAGTASWVRVSTTGQLERVTPSGSDDIVGWVETDGTFRACFGFLTPVLVNGGGSGYTPPTGTGFVTVSSGATDAASLSFPLAVNKGGTGVASLTLPASGLVVGTTDAQALTNKTIVAASNTLTDTSAATGDILRHNGTRFVRLARGSANQVLATNGAGTDIAWTTAAAGGSPGGSSGEVQTNDGAGGFAGATRITAGADFLSIGANATATGNIRLPYAFTMLRRDSGNTTDMNAVACSAGVLYLGDVNGDGIVVRTWSLGTMHFQMGGSIDDFLLTPSTVESAHPLVGSSAYSSPYGVHGESAYDMNNANQTLPAANYQFGIIKVTSTTNFTGNRQLTFPSPASDAVAYQKFVRNTQGGAFAVNVTCSGGTSVSIAQNKGAWILFDTTGAVRMSADV